MKKLLLMRYTEQNDYKVGETGEGIGSEQLLDNPTQKMIIMAFKQLKINIRELRNMEKK